MGIIKLKNVNEEQTKNVAVDEKSVYNTDVESHENAEIQQENQREWENPAVLYEDETQTDEHSRCYVLNNGTAKSVFNAEAVNFLTKKIRNGNVSTTLWKKRRRLLRVKTVV